MNPDRLWTIARLELTQRVRTVSWYVLLGVFALLLIVVTVLAFLSFGYIDDRGPGVYSTVVYLTLLLAVLVSPTLSGNSINGDRDAATLAPVQVTLATTGEILLGKLLAAWITGLAFVVVAVPFLLVAMLGGGVQVGTVLVSIVVLVVEIGVVAGIGVGLSGILARPLFSVATTYLVVAAFVVGTVIAFGLGGASATSEVVAKNRMAEYDPDTGAPLCRDGSADCWDEPQLMLCGQWETSTYRVPRFDRVWWMLAANPFVILADATPTQYDEHGNPIDLFGQLKAGVRYAQLPPPLETAWDECDPVSEEPRTPAEVVAETVPSWFVGLGIQVVVAAGLLWGGWARTRTPARTPPPGTRIA
ncbi:ABC transporter permease [Microbacterium sp.]|uniref:ABC transporter permease n=1 Tax=Microbacterium sp. TaxID=51671 RepID=UPI0039E4F50C